MMDFFFCQMEERDIRGILIVYETKDIIEWGL